jgi:hypothetical protein
MSRILRRPMFRGGPIDSRGTGITTGLDQPRIGAKRGRFFGDTGNIFTAGLALEPRGSFGSFTPRVSARGRTINPPLPINEFAGIETMTDAMPGGTYNVEQEDELINVGDVELGLPKSKVEDLTTTEEVETPKKDDDEPEVTMTDLEKALGLDRARQEYAADALAAASKAFFEGKGFGAIADAAAVKSKAPDIKRLAGLEEFKAQKAKELYKEKLDAQARAKAGTIGNLQKDINFLKGLRGADRTAALGKLGYKAPSLSAAIKELKITGQAPDAATIINLAELYIGPDFKGVVDVTEELSTKPAGTYVTTDGTALVIIDEQGKPRLQKL